MHNNAFGAKAKIIHSEPPIGSVFHKKQKRFQSLTGGDGDLVIGSVLRGDCQVNWFGKVGGTHGIVFIATAALQVTQRKDCT